MTEYTSECVDCGKPCLHEACPYYRVEHKICDECNDEARLYRFNDEELCINCIQNRLEEV